MIRHGGLFAFCLMISTLAIAQDDSGKSTDSDEERVTAILEILSQQKEKRITEVREFLDGLKEELRTKGRSLPRAQTAELKRRITQSTQELRNLERGPEYYPLYLDPFRLEIDTIGYLPSDMYEVYRVVGPEEVMVKWKTVTPGQSGFRSNSKKADSPVFVIQGMETRGFVDKMNIRAGEEGDLFQVTSTKSYRSGLGRTSTAFLLERIPASLLADHLPQEAEQDSRRRRRR